MWIIIIMTSLLTTSLHIYYGVSWLNKLLGRSASLAIKPTQPSILSGTENEYRPKCGDALRLGSKGRYGSFHLWINVWVAAKPCDPPSLTRAMPELPRDEFLMIKRYTNLRLLYCFTLLANLRAGAEPERTCDKHFSPHDAML